MVVQFAELKSKFCCNTKLVEDTIHDRTRFVFAAATLSFGDGVLRPIQIPVCEKSSRFAATNWEPSADDATQYQEPGTLLEIHVTPESLEV